MAEKISTHIEQYLRFSEAAIKDYGYYKERLEELNNQQEDLLHAIELNDKGYRERNKIASRLEDCRHQRRWYKDRIAELEPYISFVFGQSGRDSVEKLKQVLGQTRRVEAKQDGRMYRQRSLSKEMQEFLK